MGFKTLMLSGDMGPEKRHDIIFNKFNNPNED